MESELVIGGDQPFVGRLFGVSISPMVGSIDNMGVIDLFTLQSFFPSFPFEGAIVRHHQHLAQADVHLFCRQIILGMVNNPYSDALVAPRRQPGQPPGSFDVFVFC